MKPVGSFSKWIACGAAATALLIASSAEAAVGRATVRAVRGTAEYTMQGGQWQTLSVGKVLGPTSSVRTGVNSQVDLYLGDNGPTVRLLADTTLGLDKLNIDRTGVDLIIETFLDLKTGTIQGNVHKLAALSKYEVKTPFTVCAIKGTEYQISADGTLHVTKGSVMVAYGAARVSTVNAGQTFVPPPPTQPTANPVRQTQPGETLPPIPIEFPVQAPAAPVTAPAPVEFVSPGTGKPTGGG